MLGTLLAVVGALGSIGKPRVELTLENRALRQQLAIYKRKMPRVRLTRSDKAFWVVLSKLWADWRHALVVVVPATVVRWHRQGFRYFWTWKSKKLGRPTKDAELRALIWRMARENGFWGAPRIHGELLKVGFEVAQRTVARWMPKRNKPSGPSWTGFLGNQLSRAAAIDFFVLPTATFRVLYGFVVLDLERRKIVHVNATEHPTAEWTARQIVQAFPYDSAPKFLMRDRDSIYGERFRRCMQNMGISRSAERAAVPEDECVC